MDLDDPASASVDAETIEFSSSGSFRKLHAAKLNDNVKTFYAKIPNTRQYFRQSIVQLLKTVGNVLTCVHIEELVFSPWCICRLPS